MRLLTTTFASSGAFLRHYSDELESGALFCATRADCIGGDPVLVEIAFPALPNRAIMRGVVVSRVPDRGVWVTFLPSELTVRDFIVAMARGTAEQSPSTERSHRRYPANVPVTCEVDELDVAHPEPLETRAINLSAGGALLAANLSPRVGTRVKLMLGPTGGHLYEIHGRVAWTDQEQRFGVQFDRSKAPDAPMFRALLRRGSETGRIELGQ